MMVAEQVRSVHTTANLTLPSQTVALALVVAPTPTDVENRARVAAVAALNELGIGTLDVDFDETPCADLADCRRRVLDVTLWAAESLEFIGLPIVYYGIGTGAYATAAVAAERSDLVTAVVAQSSDLSAAEPMLDQLGERVLAVPTETSTSARFATRWLRHRVKERSLLPREAGRRREGRDYLAPIADLLHLFAPAPAPDPTL